MKNKEKKGKMKIDIRMSQIRISILFFFITVLMLASCVFGLRSSPTETAPLPTSMDGSVEPFMIVTPVAGIEGVEPQLNDISIEDDYCRSPAIFLPVSGAQGMNDDDIVEKLLELWLAYFNVPQAPDYCRIDGYRIDRVYFDVHTPYLTLEPQGDFIRTVQFSVKLDKILGYWMSWAGEIDQNNWLHTGSFIAVSRSSDGYSLMFARP